jgi:hypothetical protein
MQRLLLCSLLANLAFAGWLWLFRSPPPAPVAAPASSRVEIRYVTNAVPFRWAQLESTSYPEYIANLRAVGCPEPTIRDIITADLQALFAARRERLVATNSEAATRQRLTAALDREEQIVKGQLLASVGGTPVERRSSPPPTAPAPSAATETEQLMANLAEHPQLAQLRQYYAALKPADAELKLLHELQQNYAAEFGNSSAPANDPATEARRRAAVRDLYDLLGSLLGYERFNEYLRETVAQSQPKP